MLRLLSSHERTSMTKRIQGCQHRWWAMFLASHFGPLHHSLGLSKNTLLHISHYYCFPCPVFLGVMTASFREKTTNLPAYQAKAPGRTVGVADTPRVEGAFLRRIRPPEPPPLSTVGRPWPQCTIPLCFAIYFSRWGSVSFYRCCKPLVKWGNTPQVLGAWMARSTRWASCEAVPLRSAFAIDLRLLRWAFRLEFPISNQCLWEAQGASKGPLSISVFHLWDIWWDSRASL